MLLRVLSEVEDWAISVGYKKKSVVGRLTDCLAEICGGIVLLLN